MGGDCKEGADCVNESSLSSQEIRGGRRARGKICHAAMSF